MHGSDEFQDKMMFLVKAIPELDRISRIGKERLSRSFKEVVLPANHLLFFEGS
jgi:hypothetical protein